MHIPDNYIGPQTYGPALAVMGALWAVGTAKVKGSLRARQVPLLAFGAAFTFVVMMFNIPVIGGTTGHAVGAVLVAILLGPWAAMVAVSMALIVQALLFGDGGITAIGANCLNMAVVMPFAGWWTYRLAAGSSPADARRRCVAAAIGGYVGLNAAALTTAVMFGIQPAIAHDAAGRALYCPFGLSVAVPAMALAHLTVFGIAEAVVTGVVVGYLQRTAPELIPVPSREPQAPGRLPLGRLAGIVATLALLSPLGLYLPARFGAGSAWGEWSADKIAAMVGYLPAGMAKAGGWRAPMPEYGLPGAGSSSAAAQGVVYALAALAGIAAVGGLAWAFRAALARRG